MSRLVRSFVLLFPLTLTGCASVICPSGQQLSEGLCVCSNTLEPPSDGVCAGGGVCDTDGCDCSLEGIEAAIALGGTRVLKCEEGSPPVTPRQTIVIDNDVVLDGQGHLVIRGDDRTRLLEVQAFEVGLIGFTITDGDQGLHVLPDATVTLTNSIVRDNTSTAAPGGGIRNEGTLTLAGTTVEGNTAALGAGGGIYNGQGAMLTVNDSEVNKNAVTAGAGAGIGNDGGTVVLNGSEVSDNDTGADQTLDGGGISSIDGTLMLTDCALQGNMAGDRGGGISVVRGTVEIVRSDLLENAARIGGGLRATDASVTVTNSNWLRNTGRRFGGGIHVSGADGELILANSTVSENKADPPGALFEDAGGGIEVDGGAAVTIISSTIHANSADSGIGSGLYITDDGNSTMIVRSSTISGNAETGVTNANPSASSLSFTQTIIENTCDLISGATVSSFGNNIESPGDTCGFDDSTDMVGVSPTALALADELADNGGDTLTLLPGVLSEAIDYFFGVCDQPEDQRGVSRPQGNGCDIGAVEVE